MIVRMKEAGQNLIVSLSQAYALQLHRQRDSPMHPRGALSQPLASQAMPRVARTRAMESATDAGGTTGSAGGGLIGGEADIASPEATGPVLSGARSAARLRRGTLLICATSAFPLARSRSCRALFTAAARPSTAKNFSVSRFIAMTERHVPCPVDTLISVTVIKPNAANVRAWRCVRRKLRSHSTRFPYAR
jgi:hypothetical protein